MIANQCAKDSHDFQKIKYLCIDPSCHGTEKLGCADCFLQDHVGHQRVHTEEFINQASSKIQDLKQEHCDSIFKTISELNDSIDLEFDNCAGAIMQRFDNVKSAIKQSIESDVQAIQAKQDEINEEIEQEALKINQMIERPLHELSEDQILQLTSLYHDFASIQAKHQGSIDLLRQERDHIKLKKQKHLRKLNQVVNALLREFGDKASPQKDTDNEAVRCATPEKRRGITNSQNSATKSPPNIVEMVRSGRRNFVQQNKKIVPKKRAEE